MFGINSALALARLDGNPGGLVKLRVGAKVTPFRIILSKTNWLVSATD